MSSQFRSQLLELLPRLRRFARALTGDRDRADDLVQEVCLRALLRPDQFVPGSRFDSWVFRIAQNIVIDEWRSRQARGTVVPLDAAASVPSNDGPQVAEHRLTFDAVARAMEQLPQDQRVLIALVCIDGRSYSEAAEIVGAPIGTVMSRLARGRTALYQRLNDGRRAAKGNVA